MKRITPLLTLFLLLITTSCFQSKVPELYSFALDDQYGYLDKKGKIVIPFQFDEAYPFTDELALVKVDEKYGYINKKGVYKINLEFDEATPFFEGVAVVVREGGAPTIINTKGKEIAVLKEAECVLRFSEGLAAFSKRITDSEGNYSLSWGFINAKGEVVIPPTYSDVEDFSEGLAHVSTKDGTCHYIDKNNKKRITLPKDWHGRSMFDGMAVVYDDNNHAGFINKSGKVVITPQYEEAAPFVEGLAAVSVGGSRSEKFVFVNKKGKIVSSVYEGDPSCFIYGLAPVLMGDNCALIDKKWKVVFPPTYEEAIPVNDNIILIASDNNCGAINKENDIIISPIYSNCNSITFIPAVDRDMLKTLKYVSVVHSQYFDVDAVVDSFMSNITDNTFFGVSPGQSIIFFINNPDYKKKSPSLFRSISEIKILPEVTQSRIDYSLKYGTPTTFSVLGKSEEYQRYGVGKLSFSYGLTGHAQNNGELIARALASKLQEKGGIIQEKGESITVEMPIEHIKSPQISIDYSRYQKIVATIDFPEFPPVEVFENGKVPDEYLWLIEGGTWYDNPWGYEGTDYSFMDNWQVKTSVFDEKTGDYSELLGKWAIIANVYLAIMFEEQEQSITRYVISPISRLLVGDKETFYPEKDVRTEEQKKKTFSWGISRDEYYYHIDHDSNGVFAIFHKTDNVITDAVFNQYSLDDLKSLFKDEIMRTSELRKINPTKSITLSIKNGNEFYNEQGVLLATGYSVWSNSRITITGNSDQWFLGDYNNQ